MSRRTLADVTPATAKPRLRQEAPANTRQLCGEVSGAEVISLCYLLDIVSSAGLGLEYYAVHHKTL